MKAETLKMRFANFLPGRTPGMLAARQTPSKQDGLTSPRQKNMQSEGRVKQVLMSGVTERTSPVRAS